MRDSNIEKRLNEIEHEAGCNRLVQVTNGTFSLEEIKRWEVDQCIEAAACYLNNNADMLIDIDIEVKDNNCHTSFLAIMNELSERMLKNINVFRANMQGAENDCEGVEHWQIVQVLRAVVCIAADSVDK